jgi:hypothetical protein
VNPDPVRLLAKEDDDFAASLLRSARDGDAEAARDHKAAVLGAAGGAAVGGVALLAAKLSTRSLWSSIGAKWLAAGALIFTGTAGLGAVLLTAGPQSPPHPSAREAPQGAAKAVAAETAPPAVTGSPASEAPAAAAAPAEPGAIAAEPGVPTDAPSPGKAAPSPKRSAADEPPAASPSTVSVSANAPVSSSTNNASSAGATSLADEVAALRDAHQALGRGQARKCLDAVNAYFARFPSGHLAAEARFLRVQALALAGQRAEAAALARTMLAQNPRSPYAARLRSIAGEDAAPQNP